MVRALKLMLGGAFLTVAMFAAGYWVATRHVFPGPEPPPDLLDVPGLIGLELSDAGARVDQAGLALGAIDSLYHPTVPASSILGQTPLPGQLALPGAVVELAISLGPEERVVPDVTGEREERARLLLGANGFSVAVDSVENDEPAGEVLTMEPEAGTGVNLPFEIRLAISLGPPVVEMPFLFGLSEEEAFILLDSLGLFVTEIQQEPVPGMEQGVVIDQDPPPAATVEVGSEVRLVTGDRALVPPGASPADTAGSQGRPPGSRDQSPEAPEPSSTAPEPSPEVPQASPGPQEQSPETRTR